MCQDLTVGGEAGDQGPALVRARQVERGLPRQPF